LINSWNCNKNGKCKNDDLHNFLMFILYILPLIVHTYYKRINQSLRIYLLAWTRWWMKLYLYYIIKKYIAKKVDKNGNICHPGNCISVYWFDRRCFPSLCKKAPSAKLEWPKKSFNSPKLSVRKLELTSLGSITRYSRSKIGVKA